MWIIVPKYNEIWEAVLEEIEFVENIWKCRKLGVGAQHLSNEGISECKVNCSEYQWNILEYASGIKSFYKIMFLIVLKCLSLLCFFLPVLIRIHLFFKLKSFCWKLLQPQDLNNLKGIYWIILLNHSEVGKASGYV